MEIFYGYGLGSSEKLVTVFVLASVGVAGDILTKVLPLREGRL